MARVMAPVLLHLQSQILLVPELSSSFLHWWFNIRLGLKVPDKSCAGKRFKINIIIRIPEAEGLEIGNTERSTREKGGSEKHSSNCTHGSESVFIEFYEKTYEGYTHYIMNLA